MMQKRMKGADKGMKTRRFIRKLTGIVLLVLLGIGLSAGAFWGVKGYQLYQDSIAEVSIEEKVEEIRGQEHFIDYSELSDFYINAVLSVEDHRFMKHCGIDPVAICRAAWIDITKMSFEEGGSTITQQLAKNLLFTQEKTITRKAAEVFAAFVIEGKYSKEEIFELYVNTIYFGSGYYGIYEAAKGYFGKEPSQLADYEAAVLAGVPNAPSVYSPDVNSELAAQRTDQVLRSMVRNHFLTQEKVDELNVYRRIQG